MMPCPAHPDVDVDGCMVCKIYWDIMRVNGRRNERDIDVGSFLRLAALSDTPRPLADVPPFAGHGDMCGTMTTANLVAGMITWMRNRGIRLYRAELLEDGA